jgi:hypothetical protein
MTYPLDILNLLDIRLKQSQVAGVQRFVQTLLLKINIYKHFFQKRGFYILFFYGRKKLYIDT